MSQHDTTYSYVVIFTAGGVSQSRMPRLGIELGDAVRQAIGKVPTPFAMSTSTQITVWGFSSGQSIGELYDAIYRQFVMRGANFSSGMANPDKLMLVDVGQQGMLATDATIKTALNLR